MTIPRTGALLRRGTEGLTPAHLRELLDSSAKVDEIIAEIEQRRSVYLEAEAAAQTAVDALPDSFRDFHQNHRPRPSEGRLRPARA